MIELLNADGFPVREVVALLTTLAQTSLVRILVTSCASRGQSEIGPAQIFDLDRRLFLRRDSLRRVASITAQTGVFAL